MASLYFIFLPPLQLQIWMFFNAFCQNVIFYLQWLKTCWILPDTWVLYFIFRFTWPIKHLNQQGLHNKKATASFTNHGFFIPPLQLQVIRTRQRLTLQYLHGQKKATALLQTDGFSVLFSNSHPFIFFKFIFKFIYKEFQFI